MICPLQPQQMISFLNDPNILRAGIFVDSTNDIYR
jgi:hypothetical protein